MHTTARADAPAVDRDTQRPRGGLSPAPRWVPSPLTLAAVLVLLGGDHVAQAGGGCSDTEAAVIVGDFYASKGRSQNVPPAKALAESGPPFSRRLWALLRSAADYRAQYIRTHPPEPQAGVGVPPVVYKPPFVDGNIFTGPEDDALGFTVGAVAADGGDGWQVRLHSTPQDNMSDWVVDVHVVREDGMCVIDDVRYGLDADAPTMSDTLAWRPGAG